MVSAVRFCELDRSHSNVLGSLAQRLQKSQLPEFMNVFAGCVHLAVVCYIRLTVLRRQLLELQCQWVADSWCEKLHSLFSGIDQLRHAIVVSRRVNNFSREAAYSTSFSSGFIVIIMRPGMPD